MAFDIPDLSNLGFIPDVNEAEKELEVAQANDLELWPFMDVPEDNAEMEAQEEEPAAMPEPVPVP